MQLVNCTTPFAIGKKYRKVVIRSPPQCKMSCWKNNVIRGFTPCDSSLVSSTSFHDFHRKTDRAQRRIDSVACYEDSDSRVVFKLPSYLQTPSREYLDAVRLVTSKYSACDVPYQFEQPTNHTTGVSMFLFNLSSNDSQTNTSGNITILHN